MQKYAPLILGLLSLLIIGFAVIVVHSGCASTGGGLVGDACYYAQQVCASATAICEVVNRRAPVSEVDEAVKEFEHDMDSLRQSLSKRNALDSSNALDYHLERMESFADSLIESAYTIRRE